MAEGDKARLVLIDPAAAPDPWRGAWIREPLACRPKAAFCAKRVFDAAAPPGRAVVHIAADTRYALFCNGELLGRGPVRATHKAVYFDSYDIAPALAPGRNVLAVAVYAMGRSTFGYIEAAPGLTVCGPAGLGLDSGAEWRVRPCEAYDPGATLFSQQIGWSELYRADLEDPDWLSPSVNGWKLPERTPVEAALAGRELRPRPLPAMTDEPVGPRAIAQTFAVPPCEDEARRADYAVLMHEEPHEQAARGAVSGESDFLHGRAPLEIAPPGGGSGVGVLLDFGRLETGCVAFEVEGPAGAVMDIGYNESLLDDRLPTATLEERAGGIHYRFADRYVFGDGPRRHAHLFAERAGRYVQLVFREFDAPIRLRSFRIRRFHTPAKLRGRFSSSDLVLDRLYLASARTLQACMKDVYMDCPWREQALYTGDTWAQALFEHFLFGDGRLTRHCLEMVTHGMTERGLLPCAYPCESGGNIPSFSLFWLLTLADYVRHTGDASLIEPLWGTAERLLETFEAQRSENGLLRPFEGLFNFYDWGYGWGKENAEDEAGALSLLHALALRAAAGLAERVGKTAAAAACSAGAAKTVIAANRLLWDPDRRVYADYLTPSGARSESVSQHTNALAVLAGAAAGERLQAALDALQNPPPGMAVAEPFFQLLVLDAMARNARLEGALDFIRKKFGPMQESGPGTIWEVWCGKKGPYRDAVIDCYSLCHGFSAAMLYLFPTRLLGVEPLEDGFARFRCAPQTGGLEFAQGEIPTPCGRIQVSWMDSPRQFGMTVSVPVESEMVCELSVPARGRSAVVRDMRSRERPVQYPTMEIGPGKHVIIVKK